MTPSTFTIEYESACALAGDYLDALQTFTKPNPHATRNLILDIFAQERAFVRCFQALVDPKLESRAGQHWASAVLAEHDWSFQNMGTLIINDFNDNWHTSNCILAICIMQALGTWLGYAPHPSWKDYIENRRLSFCPDQPGFDSSQIASNRPYERKGLTRPLDLRENSQSRIAKHRQNSGPEVLARLPNSQVNAPTFTSNYASSKPNVIVLAFACTALSIGGFIVIAPTLVNTTSSNSNQATQQPSNEHRNEPLAHLQTTLNSYTEQLRNSRLVCEYAAVDQNFQSLIVYASAANRDDLVKAARRLAAEAQKRMSNLNQSGITAYREDCSIGIGYQPFDSFTWKSGSDFRGTLFLVAKKDCLSPSVEVKTIEAGTSQQLFSQVISFNPSLKDGSHRVGYSVPAAALENARTIKNVIHSLKCN
jgi:hypothetical protein